MDKKKYEEYTTENYEQNEILLKKEKMILMEKMILAEELIKSENENEVKRALGMRRGIKAKHKQLSIIYALMLIQRHKNIKFTANFCERIIKNNFKKNIQKQILYKFFSYKKQHDIIFKKNTEIEDFCSDNEFKIYYEKAFLTLLTNNNKKTLLKKNVI